MDINTKGRKVSFGWKHSTHRLISKITSSRFNRQVSPDRGISWELLQESCVAPDFSRKVIPNYARGHFADIDNYSADPPDALALLKKYTNKAIDEHEKSYQGDTRDRLNKRDNYIGYALHFLQDMLNPFHVVFRTLPKEHPERVAHTHFEKLAQKIEKGIIGQIKLPETPENSSFWARSLPDAMRQTKTRWDKVKSLDLSDEEYTAIAGDSLKTTHMATDAYLGGLARKFNEISTSRAERKELNILA